MSQKRFTVNQETVTIVTGKMEAVLMMAQEQEEEIRSLKRGAEGIEARELRLSTCEAVEFQRRQVEIVSRMLEIMRDLALICLGNHNAANDALNALNDDITPLKDAGVFYKYRGLFAAAMGAVAMVFGALLAAVKTGAIKL